MPTARALRFRALLLFVGAVLALLAVMASRLWEGEPAREGRARDAPVAPPHATPPPTLHGTRKAARTDPSEVDAAAPPPTDGTGDAWSLSAWTPSKVTVRDGETGAVLDAPWDTDVEVGQGWFLINVVVKPPPGYVQWEQVGWLSYSAPLVRAYEVVVPLRRKVPVWVTLSREDGTRLEDATLWWRLESGPWNAVTPEGEVTHVHGVPHFGGRNLRFKATDGTAGGNASARLPVSWRTPLDVEIRLGEPEAPGIAIEVETDEDLPFEESLGDSFDSPDAETASLQVRVTRRNGSPATEVPIRLDQWVKQTDESGSARFTGLEAGNHKLCIPGGWGVAPMGRTVALQEGEAAAFEWRESEGGVLEVAVVDGKGRELPFASIVISQASGAHWVDQDGEFQRVDPFTDERGQRRFDHVEAGRVRVNATWGGRSSALSVDVREGETLPVRLVIR